MIRPREAHDQKAVEALLDSAGLPAAGLDRTEGWVLVRDGRVQGHVALERAEGAAVLRSLVVDPIIQGRGAGRELMTVAEEAGRPGTIILKTDTIAAWVQRRGYRPTTLGEVPPGARSTSQFEGALCAGTPLFLKELP